MRLRRQRSKLRSTLEGLTRGRDTAKYLQDQIVTDRNGRYVVVVRAEHRDAIPGIVHGASASGASLYLEPLARSSSTTTSSRWPNGTGRDSPHSDRADQRLSRAGEPELEALSTSAAELDELHAKARLAGAWTASAPTLAADGRIEFRGARHPLLSSSLSEDSEARESTEATPSDLFDRAAGPRARHLRPEHRRQDGRAQGGRTAGAHGAGRPADSGRRRQPFTPFRTVFADIGDEQSIAASLSTFSAHIANIVAMDRALELPALVLLDEVGGGTDPVEGGALGAAVIDHFRQARRARRRDDA